MQKRPPRLTWLVLAACAPVFVAAISLEGGCTGSMAPFANNPGGSNPGLDPFAPCTQATQCCAENELTCVGDPDKGVVCTCSKLWDCSLNATKCSQPIVAPDGTGGWNCTTWTEQGGLVCEKEGTASNVPPGGDGRFICSYAQELGKVVCKEQTPSNPSNTPAGAGAWNCKPTSSEGPQKLVCDRTDGGGGTPSGSGSGGTEPGGTGTGGSGGSGPSGVGEWNCNSDGSQCKKQDGDKGLPPGGSNWTCHYEIIGGTNFIVCTGTSPNNPEDNPPTGGSGTGSGGSGGSTPGGSGGWTCDQLPNTTDGWICKRPESSGDKPAGTGEWACADGSEFGGLVCDKVPQKPLPPLPSGTPGEVCTPGTTRWCDGLQFCGWGTVTCKPDGTWATKTINGKTMLDCHERADGKRPNTTCACYHFYFNPKCCERPDCIVPENTDGQICPKSSGKLCDYCNPQKPECQTGICAVSNSMETFCTASCGAGSKCPTGMICQQLKSGGKVSNQCVPADLSCYNGI